MVVVPKNSGAVRIYVDLKPLNKSMLREVHPMPKVDTTLALLSDAKVFSKLDANSGFWQISLAEKSRLLTTFITPLGHFCFNKLPFGISSAPEIFQRRMNEVLSGPALVSSCRSGLLQTYLILPIWMASKKPIEQRNERLLEISWRLTLSSSLLLYQSRIVIPAKAMKAVFGYATSPVKSLKSKEID